MGLYERYILPRLINLSMQSGRARAERERYVPLAAGTVLEVGLGSALNVPFYSDRVRKLYGLDPSIELARLGRKRLGSAPFPVEYIEASAEHLPMKDQTVDTVVTTWTLCSIPDPATALREIRRVLKAGGQLIVVEHGRAPDPGVRAWQDRLNPLWQRWAGGCNLNRPIDDLIVQAGFHFDRIEKGYTQGPKPFTYFYRGVAKRLE